MNSTAQTLKRLLTKDEQFQFFVIVAVAVGLALSEAAGIASIIPFLSVITNPDTIQNNPYLSEAYQTLRFTSEDAFRTATGAFAVAAFALGAIYKIAANYLVTKFIARRRQSLSRRLLQSFLQRPYSYFLSQNPANITKSIMSEAEIAVSRFIRPLVDALASSLVVLALVILIVVINPKAAMAIALSLGMAYLLIYALLRGSIARSGQLRLATDRARYKSVQEVIGGIKEIKLLGTEANYLKLFEQTSEKLTQLDAKANVLAFVPRYTLETVAIAVLVFIALLMQPEGGPSSAFLPSLGAYAIAGFRLLPAVQKLYASAVEIRYGKAAAQAVAEELSRLRQPLAGDARPPPPSTSAPALKIRLEDLSFTYPQSKKKVLRHINLTIPTGAVLGLAGDSGAGKSTLVDIILGLLPASEGRVIIDGQALTETVMRRWHQQIGYVPQSIYLADQTVATNIAFCESLEEIDMDQVVRAATTAQIHSSIVAMPDGYDTRIGDRGVRLSGGQRQRIGIARALYRHPELLVLDEATNAIDTGTERQLMDSIRSTYPDQTLILITHRLDGLKVCDTIAWLEDGVISRQGTYTELFANNT